MSYQLGLRQLKYFLAVAENLHFGKAAEQLYISQPGISKQIDRLEKELNTKLFDRDNRNVKLTKAGTYLKAELGISLKHIEDILAHTKLIHDGKEGSINIGYVGSAMQSFIPELMIRFRKQYPTIKFNLSEMHNEFQLKGLMNQNLDLGFVRLGRVPSGLNLRPFQEDTFSIVLPKSHPLNQDNFKSLYQLKEESFILFKKNYSAEYYERVIRLFEEANFSPLVSHTTVHAYTIFKLVENNFGISVVPTSLQKGYNMNVKFIELNNTQQRAILSVAWNGDNRNPVLEKILSFIPSIQE